MDKIAIMAGLCMWAGRGMLAIATGETSVRIWDLRTDDNYVLPSAPASSNAGGGSLEAITRSGHCVQVSVLSSDRQFSLGP